MLVTSRERSASKTMTSVEVGSDAIEALDDLVDDLDELAGRGTATLGHDEPFEESGGGAKSCGGCSVLVNGYFGGTKTRGRTGKICALCPESRTSSMRGMGSWSREPIALSFL